jgi:hypothetical protein
MKKEWMYFIAGAGLAVAIMSALNSGYSDYDECVMKESQKFQAENNVVYVLKFCRRYK